MLERPTERIRNGSLLFKDNLKLMAFFDYFIKVGYETSTTWEVHISSVWQAGRLVEAQ